MTRFDCIGAACEEDCCTGWQVRVDEPHLVRLRQRMASPAEVEELARKLETPETPTEGRAAFMRLDEHERCTMLDADRLCSIQRRYGEEYLPNGCAIFPRF